MQASGYEEKVAQVAATLSPLLPGSPLDVHPAHWQDGVCTGWRQRCKFGVTGGQLTKWDVANREARPVDVSKLHALACPRICELVAKMQSSNKDVAEALSGAFAMRFLTANSGDALATVQYKHIEHVDAEAAAAKLAQLLGIDVVARCRSLPDGRLVHGKDYVTEKYTLQDGRELVYKQLEGFFSNPNFVACTQTINWLCSCADMLVEGRSSPSLLELYCGNGNHTVALAPKFRRVLGVELHPTLCEAANFNLSSNLSPSLASATEITSSPAEFFCGRALQPDESFFQDESDLRALLVDPPRCGLDDVTLNLCQKFDAVMYISCSFESLMPNLDKLLETHRIVKGATFDHFPGTEYIETGLLLLRREH